MAYNGSGTFSLAAGNPVVTGTTVSSTWANNTLSDIATGLSTAVTKDGQTTVTANLPMATFRHTGVGTATALTMYARADQIQNCDMTTLSSVAGTVTAITGTATPTPSAYAAGQEFTFTPGGTNTGATTINVSGLGAKNIFANGAACVGGELAASRIARIKYDGTQFQLVNFTPINQLTAETSVAMADEVMLFDESAKTYDKSTVQSLWNSLGALSNVSPLAPSDSFAVYDADGTVTGKTQYISLFLNIDELTAASATGSLDYIGGYSAGEDDGRKFSVRQINGTHPASQATTSGNAVTFGSIPVGVTWIEVNVMGVSSNGTAQFGLQIGDVDGLENTGYAGGVSLGATNVAHNTFFGVVTASVAANAFSGRLRLQKGDTDHTWTIGGQVSNATSGGTHNCGGMKTLSAELTQISFLTTDTLDLGKVSVSYGF